MSSFGSHKLAVCHRHMSATGLWQSPIVVSEWCNLNIHNNQTYVRKRRRDKCEKTNMADPHQTCYRKEQLKQTRLQEK